MLELFRVLESSKDTEIFALTWLMDKGVDVCKVCVLHTYNCTKMYYNKAHSTSFVKFSPIDVC